MRPWMLAVAAILVMAASGAMLAGLFTTETGPAGAIASDTVTISVGEPRSLIGGPEIGLLVGAGMLLTSFIWHRNESKTGRNRVRSPK